MTTSIRLTFRNGPATTLVYDGSFQDFQRDLRLKMSDMKNLYGTSSGIVFFSTFAVNLSELALAVVTSVQEDAAPVVEEKKE